MRRKERRRKGGRGREENTLGRPQAGGVQRLLTKSEVRKTKNRDNHYFFHEHGEAISVTRLPGPSDVDHNCLHLYQWEWFKI